MSREDKIVASGRYSLKLQSVWVDGFVSQWASQELICQPTIPLEVSFMFYFPAPSQPYGYGGNGVKFYCGSETYRKLIFQVRPDWMETDVGWWLVKLLDKFVQWVYMPYGWIRFRFLFDGKGSVMEVNGEVKVETRKVWMPSGRYVFLDLYNSGVCLDAFSINQL
jgi:hypothetical protein